MRADRIVDRNDVPVRSQHNTDLDFQKEICRDFLVAPCAGAAIPPLQGAAETPAIKIANISDGA
jgi:hypothetical protein